MWERHLKKNKILRKESAFLLIISRWNSFQFLLVQMNHLVSPKVEHQFQMSHSKQLMGSWVTPRGSIKGIVMKIEWLQRYSHKWLHKCFKIILKILHSNYLWFYSNVPMKLAIFLKGSLLFNNYYGIFCL